MILCAVFSLLQFWAPNREVLFILRMAIGFTIAMDYTSGSALLTEWLPKKDAGRYQTYLLIYWTIGFVIPVLVDAVFPNVGVNTWRWLIITSAVPAMGTVLVRAIYKIPESPSWLAAVGREQEANELVAQHIGPAYEVKETAKAGNTKQARISELFKNGETARNLSAGVMYGTQVFPFFALGIFINIVLQGLNIRNPIISSLVYNGFVFLGTLLGIWLFEKVSRRGLMLWTYYICIASLILMLIVRKYSVPLAMVAFAVFALSMAAGSILEYPYPAELFETRLRGTGVGVTIFISRIAAALGTFVLPILVEKYRVDAAFLACTGVLAFGAIYCQLFAPETSLKRWGKALDE